MVLHAPLNMMRVNPDNFRKSLAFKIHCRAHENQELGGYWTGTLIMQANTNCTLPLSFALDETTAASHRVERRWWSVDLRNIGLVFATNTTLFCALDIAQWLADRYTLSMLPTNLIAAMIATVLGLAFAAQGLGGRSPSQGGVPQQPLAD
jgi:hypothetical protein